MLGATVPISIAKASAQIMAEAFGAFTILKLLSDDELVGFKMRMFGFDMKDAFINYGTPESILLDIITADLNKHYGNAAIFQINTMAKEVGVQSGVEKISSALFGIMNEARALADIGSLCLDELFSPEQAVYDCEILDNAMRLARGLDFEEFDTDSFIDELRQTRTFLESDETIKSFRNVYWMSKLFSRSMLQQYLSRKENQRERVKEIVKEKIKEHDFELDDDKRKEINRIYRAAEKELQ
jgi:trimethylamine:corrinoid methyltransferase-like protein